MQKIPDQVWSIQNINYNFLPSNTESHVGLAFELCCILYSLPTSRPQQRIPFLLLFLSLWLKLTLANAFLTNYIMSFLNSCLTLIKRDLWRKAWNFSYHKKTACWLSDTSDHMTWTCPVWGVSQCMVVETCPCGVSPDPEVPVEHSTKIEVIK